MNPNKSFIVVGEWNFSLPFAVAVKAQNARLAIHKAIDKKQRMTKRATNLKAFESIKFKP
jgi:hypothetical protein